MADLGAITTPPPWFRGVPDPLTLVRSALSYPMVAALQTPRVPIPAVGHYRLAGTQQLGAGYVIPSVGQLWPRGARGEIVG